MMLRRNSRICSRAALIVCASMLSFSGCATELETALLGPSNDQNPAPLKIAPGLLSVPPANSPAQIAAAQPTGTLPPSQSQYPSQAYVSPPPMLPAANPPAATSATSTADPRELTALVDEVQALGVLDPQAQRDLLNNLKQCDPKLWPQMIRQFKTLLAYHRQIGANPPQSNSAPTQIADTSAQPAAASAAVAPKTGSSAPPPSSNVAQSLPETKPPVAAKLLANDKPNSEKNVAESRAADKPAAVEKASFEKLPASKPAKPAAIVSSATSDTWSDNLNATILELESETASGGTTPADIDRQINLRMLYLAAGRKDEAMRPISGMSPDQQQFWSKEIYALATLRDTAKQPDLERRATEATLHLREAATDLGDLAAPVVRNLAFCKEVTSFGVYTKFPNYEFAAGDEALLYCELENLKASATERGYHTAVKGTYELLDSHGSRVAEQEFPVSDDFCANIRRDFFILYHIWVPKQIAAGSYTLQLTIEDMQTNKIGQSSVQFKVR